MGNKYKIVNNKVNNSFVFRTQKLVVYLNENKHYVPVYEETYLNPEETHLHVALYSDLISNYYERKFIGCFVVF